MPPKRKVKDKRFAKKSGRKGRMCLFHPAEVPDLEPSPVADTDVADVNDPPHPVRNKKRQKKTATPFLLMRMTNTDLKKLSQQNKRSTRWTRFKITPFSTTNPCRRLK